MLLFLLNQPAAAISAAAAQSLSLGQAAADTVLVQDQASQGLTIGQVALCAVGGGPVTAIAAQSLGLGQAAADTVLIKDQASQGLVIRQAATATVGNVVVTFTLGPRSVTAPSESRRVLAA